MASEKKSGKKKKGRSAFNGEVTREYTVNIHMPVHRVGFKKRAPRALRDPQSWHEGDGKSDVCTDTRLNKAVWATGVRDASYYIPVWLSGKQRE